MPKFGFCGPTYRSQSPSQADNTAMNWYPESSEGNAANSPIALYPTPGLRPFVDLTPPAFTVVESFSAAVTSADQIDVALTNAVDTDDFIIFCLRLESPTSAFDKATSANGSVSPVAVSLTPSASSEYAFFAGTLASSGAVGTLQPDGTWSTDYDSGLQAIYTKLLPDTTPVNISKAITNQRWSACLALFGSTGTPAILQSRQYVGSFNGGLAGPGPVFLSPVTAGSVLVCVFSARGSNLNRTPAVTSDDQGDTWHTAALNSNGTAGNAAQTAIMYSDPIVGGAAPTLSMDLPSSSGSVVEIFEVSNLGLTVTITDSGGNSYTKELTGSDSLYETDAYLTKVVTGGSSFHVDVNFNTGATAQLTGAVIRNLNALDKKASTFGTGTAGVYNSGTVTTTAASELAIAFCATTDGSTPAIDDDFTQILIQNQIGMAYKQLFVIGSVSSSWAAGAASDTFVPILTLTINP